MNEKEILKMAEQLGRMICNIGFGSVGVELTVHNGKVVKKMYTTTEKTKEA